MVLPAPALPHQNSGPAPAFGESWALAATVSVARQPFSEQKVTSALKAPVSERRRWERRSRPVAGLSPRWLKTSSCDEKPVAIQVAHERAKKAKLVRRQHGQLILNQELQGSLDKFGATLMIVS